MSAVGVGTAKHVLVIDDDALLLKGLRRSFSKQCTVKTAGSCERAHRLVELEHFDLAIVDYYVRDQNGFDVIAKLRESDPGLPAVIYSGLTTGSVTERARELGIPWFDKSTPPNEVLSRFDRGDEDDNGLPARPPLTPKEARRRYYVELVAEHGGNVSLASARTSHDRATIQRNLRPGWLVEENRRRRGGS